MRLVGATIAVIVCWAGMAGAQEVDTTVSSEPIRRDNTKPSWGVKIETSNMLIEIGEHNERIDIAPPKDAEPDIRARWGARIEMSYLGIIYDYNNSKTVGIDGIGGSVLGVLTSFPLSNRITFEPGLDFQFRPMVGKTFQEGALNMPLMFRFSTSPPPRFAFYAEGGAQLGFPLWTTNDDGFIPPGNRSIVDFGAVWGAGITSSRIQSDISETTFGNVTFVKDYGTTSLITYLIGYRNVTNVTTVFKRESGRNRGEFGRLFQHQVYIAVIR